MRLSELSRRTGVSAAMVKFYLRSRLLTPGVLRNSTQADYGPEHEHQLRLIRALTGPGQLSVERARHVMEALREPYASPRAATVVGHGPGPDLAAAAQERDREWERAARAAQELLTRRGWPPADAAARALTGVVAVANGLDHDGLAECLDAYADAAQGIVRAEAGYAAGADGAHAAAERAVVSAVLGGAILAVLCAVAREAEFTDGGDGAS
ncbi:MerR family transcriptional regulator [Streptomyces melanogenes]|uniref:MerR family transcriptional regulator n=1 Tax=Streptomyces melanogenes TaxID=67326 RepID=UPI00167D63DA|nr:MerR family transcriptional regulator [Streptomyces melanogenes]GGP89320.1 MerR family transcriptional regulator [Streptomyces melanogenes]